MAIENDINIPAMVAATSQGIRYPVYIHKIPVNKVSCAGCLFETKSNCLEMDCGVGQPDAQQYIYILDGTN